MGIARDHGFSHKRSLASAVGAIAKPRNYTGVLKLVRQCTRPFEFLKRYLRGSGSYPAQVRVRTPSGGVVITAHSSDDILTINEIFFRGDYGDQRDDEVVVDFGSNIGISTLYFLSRNARCRAYCHEPLPQNIERLKANLAPFEGRYELREAAVAPQDGQVDFGWEPTGRYGGIGKSTGATMTVPALDSNRVLSEVIERHGRIDLLKIDIETLEYELTARIPQAIAQHVRRIVVEYPFRDNPLSATHSMRCSRPITTFRRLKP